MTALSQAPFHLDAEALNWVRTTLAGMSLTDKVGQVFCLTSVVTDAASLAAFVKKARPGAYMHRAGDSRGIREANLAMQTASEVPLLLAANLESGGNGISLEGTYYAKPLQIAATGKMHHAVRLGLVSAREAAALGCNWSFAPVADIDFNWRNPITNVRTFGAHPEQVAAYCAAYLQGVRESGAPLAVCPKHFPGDGVDERDHHLLASVNSLDEKAWEASFGLVYRRLIASGAPSIMAGHILQPALTRALSPGIADQDILPASVSHELLQGLLRDKLGFQGLIVTDATPMVGFQAALPRAQALRAALMAGADMLLFSKNLEEDYGAILDGLRDGSVTVERLDEAISRVLALKASLGLHRLQEKGLLVPGEEALEIIGCREHRAWALACARDALTLVRNREGVLPLSTEKHKRIRLVVLGEGESGSFGDNAFIAGPLAEALRKAGFEVSLYDEATLERGEIFTAGIADLKQKFDLCLIAANVAAGSNLTTRRLDWIPLMAANAPWFSQDIPTVFVSFANPYHLFDVPYLDTFINCYSNDPATVEVLVDALVHKRPFPGNSPVSLCCGGAWGLPAD